MAIIGCYIRNDAVYAKIKIMLTQAGFDYERFTSENALLRVIGRRSFEIIMIDIGTSIRDAEWFFSWINCRSGDHTPVIAISAANNPEFAALALDSGADDFLYSQFEPLEAMARIRAAMRRHAPRNSGRSISLEGFTLDREASKIYDRGAAVELTPREFTMAWLFFSSPGVYISRSTIGSTIWSADGEIAGRTIEQHVYKLRKKLQLGAERGVTIRTAYSQGYRLEVAAACAGVAA